MRYKRSLATNIVTIVEQVDTRTAIVQNICLYEILMKRKVEIDQVAERLASLGFSDLLSSFPEEMKPIFVGGVKVPTLISHLDLIAPDSRSGEVTYNYLQQYIMDLDETGRLVH